jgi:hypothetical protein
MEIQSVCRNSLYILWHSMNIDYLLAAILVTKDLTEFRNL